MADDNVIDFPMPDPDSEGFAENMRSTLRPIYEKIARQRGYDPSRAGEIVEIVIDAAEKTRVADFRASFELPEKPAGQNLQEFANEVALAVARYVALNSLEALVVAAIDLAYPKQQ